MSGGKGGYRGGSTLIRPGSSWFGGRKKAKAADLGKGPTSERTPKTALEEKASQHLKSLAKEARRAVAAAQFAAHAASRERKAAERAAEAERRRLKQERRAAEIARIAAKKAAVAQRQRLYVERQRAKAAAWAAEEAVAASDGRTLPPLPAKSSKRPPVRPFEVVRLAKSRRPLQTKSATESRSRISPASRAGVAQERTVWALLYLTRESEAALRSFFIDKCGVPEDLVFSNLHVTVYHAVGAIDGLVDSRRPVDLKVPGSELRFMVMAPGGENARHDIDPRTRNIGLRIRRADGAAAAIQDLRAEFYEHEARVDLGGRTPSSPRQSAFGARSFQPHITVLKAGALSDANLRSYGALLRKSVPSIAFDQFVVKCRSRDAAG